MSGYGQSYGNTYEEVRYKHKGKSDEKQGLCGACCCSMIGVLLYFGCLAGIASNEMSTVCVSKALQSARDNHQWTSCAAKDASNTPGSLIYLACPIAESSLEEFRPSRFDGAHWLDGAFKENAVKMKQDVSMFQCVEHKKTREERINKDEVREIVSWEYTTEWSGSHIDASAFKAWNNNEAWQALSSACGRSFKGNPAFPMKTQAITARTLYAGDYDVSRHLDAVSADTPVNLKQGHYSSPISSEGSSSSERRTAKDGKSYTRGEFIDYYGQEQGAREWDAARSGGRGGKNSVEVFGNTVQTCRSATVGCLKVSYTKSSATRVSHLAAAGRQSGKTQAWSSPSAWMCPSSSKSNRVDLFSEGDVSAEDLVSIAQSSNAAATWAIRVICFILVIVGVYSFLQPIQAVADMVDQFLDWFAFIPILGWGLDFLGNVVSGAVGTAIVLISIGIGAPSAILVMSISWMIMRPLIGVPAVLACLALLGMTLKAMIEYARVGRENRQKRA